jgi:hypothetical protein
VEVYVDDRLVQCYVLPERAGGRLGFVAESSTVSVKGVSVREMTI